MRVDTYQEYCDHLEGLDWDDIFEGESKSEVAEYYFGAGWIEECAEIFSNSTFFRCKHCGCYFNDEKDLEAGICLECEIELRED